ncbi:response regulator [bacterium]|nr:response regulator [bacterium]
MKKKIVLIEDHPELNSIIKIRLESSDFDVISCLEGVPGLQKIKEDKPDLVILDIDLPDINGLDLLAEVRKTPDIAHIKVLVLTGLTDSTEKNLSDESYRAKLGVSSYLSKPFNTEDLKEEVKKLI